MGTIRHFGLVVNDLNKALRFYRDIMGLQEKLRTVEAGEFIDNALGEKDIQLETIKMCDENDTVLIELLKFNNPKTDSRRKPNTVTVGASHIAFTVDSIHSLYKKLNNENIEVYGRPKKSPDGNVLMTYCRDFEGNLIELVQPTSKAQKL